MQLPILSKKAEIFLDKKLHESGLDYLDFLASWKDTQLPDFETIAVKNQGILKYLESREEYEIVSEIIQYAAISIENQKNQSSSETVLLSDFLDAEMKSIPKFDREKVFKEFYIYDLKNRTNEMIDTEKFRGNRGMFLREKQDLLRQRLDAEGLPAYISKDIGHRYQQWAFWHPGNRVLKASMALRKKKKDKKADVLNLLPATKRKNEGLTKREWRDLALQIFGVKTRTFDRYFNELAYSIEISPSGKIRKKVQVPEK